MQWTTNAVLCLQIANKFAMEEMKLVNIWSGRMLNIAHLGSIEGLAHPEGS